MEAVAAEPQDRNPSRILLVITMVKMQCRIFFGGGGGLLSGVYWKGRGARMSACQEQLQRQLEGSGRASFGSSYCGPQKLL